MQLIFTALAYIYNIFRLSETGVIALTVICSGSGFTFRIRVFISFFIFHLSSCTNLHLRLFCASVFADLPVPLGRVDFPAHSCRGDLRV